MESIDESQYCVAELRSYKLSESKKRPDRHAKRTDEDVTTFHKCLAQILHSFITVLNTDTDTSLCAKST